MQRHKTNNKPKETKPNKFHVFRVCRRPPPRPIIYTYTTNSYSVCLCDVTRPCGVCEHKYNTHFCIRIAYFKNALSYLFIMFYEYYEYMYEICKFKSDIFIVLILSCLCFSLVAIKASFLFCRSGTSNTQL